MYYTTVFSIILRYRLKYRRYNFTCHCVWSETASLTGREERRLKVFGDRVLGGSI